MGLPNALGVLERPVRDAIRRLDRILTSLEMLGGSIKNIERDMTGMRSDLREVIGTLESLRGDVTRLDGSVEGIRAATVSLEDQVIGLAEHLEGVGKTLQRVDSMVPRISRRSRAAGRDHEHD
jgi:chromosome segregation ATPase